MNSQQFDSNQMAIENLKIGENGFPAIRRSSNKKKSLGEPKQFKTIKVQLDQKRETTSKKFKQIYDKCCCRAKCFSKAKQLSELECSYFIGKQTYFLEASRNQKNQQQELANLLRKLNPQQRIEKAERHIYDAIYLRTVRNDIDQYQRRFLKKCWSLVNNENWNYFLWMLAVVYQLITFFEPAHAKIKAEPNSKASHEALMNIEIALLSIWCIDIIICLSLLFTLPKGFQKINFKLILKLIFFSLLLSDFIYNSISFPALTPRFARYARPLMMIPYSKDLRRNLLGIIKTSKDLIILFILYFVVMSMFAFIGINLLPNDIEILDKNVQDYSDFFQLLFMLFVLSTFDFYPDIMVPPYLVGKFYTFFFIPFLFLYVFLFLPIPLAVVYEGFRQHRVKIAMDDIFKQKSALFSSFLCLDIDNQGKFIMIYSFNSGYLTQSQFEEFIKIIYRNQLQKEDVWEFIDCINKDQNDKIQIEEFFQIIEIIENKEKFLLPVVVPLKIWEIIRSLALEKLHLLEVVNGDVYYFRYLNIQQVFNLLMILITLLNCTLILIAFFIADENILAIFDLIDNIFLGLYILEFIIKIIALGIKDYFDDSWNVFDFSLIIFQILFDYVLYNIVSGILVQSLKANRVFRIAKIQKVFRMFRALRSIKIVGFFFTGLDILDNVKYLIYKIMICVPVILRLLIPIQIIFYFYATLGIQIFGGLKPENAFSPQECNLQGNELFYDWSSCHYMDFESFYGAYLLLIQVFIAAEWSTIVFDLSYRMNDLILPAIFIGSFVFLSIFLQALLGGLVWEVFNVVSYTLKTTEEEEQITPTNNSKQSSLNDQLVQDDLNDSEKQRPSQIDSPENNRKKRILKTFLKGSTHNAMVLIDDNPNTLGVNKNDEFFKKSRFFKQESNELENSNTQNGKLMSLSIQRQKIVFQSQIRPKQIEDEEEIILNQKGEIFQFRSNHFNLSRKIYMEEFLPLEEFKNIKNVQFNIDGDKKLATDYVNHLRNDIKNQELIKKAKDINLRNHNQLLNHAILKNTKILENIQQQENNFLSQLYGVQFQKLKDLKFKGSFKTESSVLFSLLGILKFPDVNLKYFFQILYILEQKLSLQLLPKGSFWKFIHQLSDKSWCMIEMDEAITLVPLEQGPWYYSGEMFPERSYEEIRICDKITFVNFYKNYENLTKFHKFKESLVRIARQFQIKYNEMKNDSCCIVYNLRNHNYSRTHSRQDESSNNSRYPCQEVIKTWILVLAQNTGDPSSNYQNQLHLIQFLKDIGTMIKNYEDTWFRKLNNLFQIEKNEKI